MKMELNEEGFTLVEMMIVLVATSILLIGVYGAMFSGNDQARETDIKMALQDQGREGLYKMIQEIRQSAPDRVEINGDGDEIVFDLPDATDLVDESFDVNWDGASSVTYSLSGGQLVREVDGDVTDVIANDVTGITFEGDAANPSIVTITLALQRNTIKGRSIPATPMQVAGQAEVRNS